MQIVINIPDELYKECKATELTEEIEGLPFHVIKLIANGIVLPKGHGRLCDIDAALKCMEEVADDKSSIKECAMGFFDWACSKRVVLEADKTESEVQDG